jgi:hypothetical protein
MVCETMRPILSFGLGVSLFVAAHGALAQTDLERATARDAAQAGREAFDAGQYDKAIDQFSRAEQLVHAPTHLLYLARAQAKLGKLVAAHETYLKITRETLAPKAPKAFVEAQSAAVSEQPAVDARLPSITVLVKGAAASGASIEMDGTALPSAMIGIPLPADPGQHVFKASAPAAASDPVTITVTEGAKQSVTLTLHATAAGTPAAPAATAASASTSGEPLTADSSHSGVSGLRVASYVSFGVGAVGLGLGTFFLLKSGTTRSDANKLFDACNKASLLGKCPGKGPEAEAINSKDSDADSQRNLGVVGLVAGGVGVAAGITFLILDAGHHSKDAQSSTPHITPVIGLGTLGAVGTF